MKKFVAFVMMVATVVSMAIGPEKAFAASDLSMTDPAAKYAYKLMDDAGILINIEGEYTVISQEFVPANDGEHYNWTVTAYNRELEQVETETSQMTIYDVVVWQEYIGILLENA